MDPNSWHNAIAASTILPAAIQKVCEVTTNTGQMNHGSYVIVYINQWHTYIQMCYLLLDDIFKNF